MARAYLGLGGNIGDREATLRAAVQSLRAHGELVAVSSLYETAPVGYLDQPAFLNAAVVLKTMLPARDLLSVALQIERALGRERTFQNAPRTVDIDLLLYDTVIIDEPELTLPHPRFQERAFVLVPLAEIAPTLRDPRSGHTISDLLEDLGDVSAEIQRVAEPNALTG